MKVEQHLNINLHRNSFQFRLLLADLKPEGSVVVVLEAVIGGSASGDIEHANP